MRKGTQHSPLWAWLISVNIMSFFKCRAFNIFILFDLYKSCPNNFSFSCVCSSFILLYLRKKGRGREWGYHLLVHSLNGYNSQWRVIWKLGARKARQASHVHGGGPCSLSIICCFHNRICREIDLSWNSHDRNMLPEVDCPCPNCLHQPYHYHIAILHLSQLFSKSNFH